MNRDCRTSRRRSLILAGLLIAATLVVFGRVGSFEFLMYDDEPHIVDNDRFNPVSWSSVAAFWSEQSYWGLYIPLSYSFFGLEAAISGQPLDPAVFHLGNLILHVACVLAVFALLRRMIQHDGAACAGALLFGLHPVQVESVAWISEARGLLCALFSLVAVWQFDRWSAAEPAPQKPRKRKNAKKPWFARSDLAYDAATAALVLALLSKPAAVAVPAMAAVMAIGFARRPWRRTAVGLAPWLVLAFVWVLWTKLQQPSGQMSYVAPLWARPLVAGDAAAFYLAQVLGPILYVVGLGWRLLLAPWQGVEPLAAWAMPRLYGPDYGRTPQWLLAQPWAGLCWTFPYVLLLLLVFLRNRRVWLSALGIAVAWLLPVLGLVMFNFQRISTVADRYLYVAMFGPAMAMAWALSRRWNRWTVGASVALILLLGGMSFVQTGHWRNNDTLTEYGLRMNPSSALALQHRGALLNRQGKHLEAIPWYRETIRRHPQQEEAYINLANTLLELDRPIEAEHVLRAGLAEIPVRPELFFELANALIHREAFDEGIELYGKAIEIDPAYGKARFNLGLALEKVGRAQEAEDQYRAALRDLPRWPVAHYNLANLLVRRGALAEAESHYRAAIEFDPQYAMAHTELGNLLAERGALDEAVGEYRRALKCNPTLMTAAVNLGQVLHALGHDEQAAAVFQTALEQAPEDSREAQYIRDFLQKIRSP